MANRRESKLALLARAFPLMTEDTGIRAIVMAALENIDPIPSNYLESIMANPSMYHVRGISRCCLPCAHQGVRG